MTIVHHGSEDRPVLGYDAVPRADAPWAAIPIPIPVSTPEIMGQATDAGEILTEIHEMFWTLWYDSSEFPRPSTFFAHVDQAGATWNGCAARSAACTF